MLIETYLNSYMDIQTESVPVSVTKKDSIASSTSGGTPSSDRYSTWQDILGNIDKTKSNPHSNSNPNPNRKCTEIRIIRNKYIDMKYEFRQLLGDIVYDS